MTKTYNGNDTSLRSVSTRSAHADSLRGGPPYNELWQCIDPAGAGIFALLEEKGVPWSEDISAATLDDAYFGTFSGSKPPSPVVKRWAMTNEGYLTEGQLSRLAAIIWSTNISDWLKSWGAEEEDYNPISNYDMLEVMTDDIHEKEETATGSTTYGKTDTRTDNLTTTYGKTDTRTDNLTDGYNSTVTRTDNLEVIRQGTETTEGETTTDGATGNEHKVYGLNSTAAVPSDTDAGTSSGSEAREETLTVDTSETHTGTTANAKSGSDTHTGTQATVQSGSDTRTGTQANATTGTDSTSGTKTSTDTHSYRLTRKGNIGVMTTQDMLTQERVLRAWRLFYDRVFPDVDRTLTLCIY